MGWYDGYVEADFETELGFGKWIKSVSNRECDPDSPPGKYDGELYFHMQDGTVYKMWHEQDCCEHVSIEDICGDLDDLRDCMIVKTSLETKLGRRVEERTGYDGSSTWTFYRIMTQKGEVTIRWYGSSNGYYSESVSFYRRIPDAT